MKKNENNKEIMVSVVCITYNQADYIVDTIESFLSQKVDFEYEILIHDDASDDGTAEIVQLYAERFPDKIVAILQKENQYSQGIKVIATYVKPHIRGKYVAFCEGDDFWTDINKLQRQYDYMEANPECSMCLHNGWNISPNKKRVFNSKPLCQKPCTFGVEEAIQGLGIKVVTNSFFCRADIYCAEAPEFIRIAPTGDYGRVIANALKGYIYYMPETMSAHRCEAKNSLTERWTKEPELWRQYIERQINMLDCLDRETEYQYTQLIEMEKIKQKFDTYFIIRDINALNIEPYRTMLKQLPLKKKLQFYHPYLFKVFRSIMRVVRVKNKLVFKEQLRMYKKRREF